MSNKRNWILGSIMAVAVGIGYVALTGKFPPQSETQGAIGAAHRYQTGQIAASDVTLQDAKIQAFLQTDLFQKIATDANFRSAIANPSFQAVIKNPSFQKMASDGSLSAYLNRYKGLFQREDFDAMLATKKLQKVAETEQTVHLLQNKSFVALAADPEFVAMLKDPKFDAMMEQADAQKATTVKQVQEIAETAKGIKLLGLTEMEKKNTFVNLLADGVLQKAATQAQLMDLADLLQNTKVTAMLSDNSFQELLANPKALSFVTSQEMSQVAMNLSALAQKGSPGMFAALADASVLDAISRPEMQQIANADLLQSAVGSVKN